jgi:hypothetical protein
MRTRIRVLLVLGIFSVLVIGIALKYSMRSRHPETVVVPTFESSDVTYIFDRLRSRGLRVAIPETTHFGATTSPRVRRVTPRTGTHLDWGSVATLDVTTGFIGSPVGPKDPPVYRVADFGGKSLADAVAWARDKRLYWQTDLPSLPPSNARHLFEAYIISSQRPAARSDIKLWIPLKDGVRLTPLVLDVAVR